MTQVRITARTEHFSALHAMAVVSLIDHRAGRHWLKVTWPATARIKLGRCIKQLSTTARTEVAPRQCSGVISTRKRPLGAFQPAHLKRLLGQLLTPGLQWLFQLFHKHLAKEKKARPVPFPKVGPNV